MIPTTTCLPVALLFSISLAMLLPCYSLASVQLTTGEQALAGTQPVPHAHRPVHQYASVGQRDAPADGEIMLRVRLLESHQPRAITISSDKGTLYVYADNRAEAMATIPPGRQATVQVQGRGLSVQFDRDTRTVSNLQVRVAHDALIQVGLNQGRGAPLSRSYHGALSVGVASPSSGVLLIINHVELERYVAGVVPGEYPFPEIEGVKAQTVIARTYALYSRGRYGGEYDLVDHVNSQVYEGAGRETALSREAVRATRGEVLMHRGQLINAVYSSDCGGHTADNEYIWAGRPLPYLRGRPDPFDQDSPNTTWQYRIPRQTLHRILSNAYRFNVTGIEFSAPTPEGRVPVVILTGQQRREIQANDFRLLINRHLGNETIRSTLFTARVQGDQYLFEGRGFGHGVGLCQWGARGKAIAGHDYRSIIHFYYTGVGMHNLAGATPEPVRSPITAGPAQEGSAPPASRETGRTVPAAPRSEPARGGTASPAGQTGQQPPRRGW